MGGTCKVYTTKILAENLMERPPHRLNSQHKNNTVTNLTQMGSLVVTQMELLQYTIQGKGLAEMVTSLWISYHMVRKSLLSEFHVLVFQNGINVLIYLHFVYWSTTVGLAATMGQVPPVPGQVHFPYFSDVLSNSCATVKLQDKVIDKTYFLVHLAT